MCARSETSGISPGQVMWTKRKVQQRQGGSQGKGGQGSCRQGGQNDSQGRVTLSFTKDTKEREVEHERCSQTQTVQKVMYKGLQKSMGNVILKQTCYSLHAKLFF